MLINIVNIVLPVFLVILVGYILGHKYKKLNIEQITFLLVYITGPALIFTSLVKSKLVLKEFFIMVFVTSLIIIISGLVVFIIFKLFKVQHKGLYLPMTIGNTGYLGYPISSGAFGVDGLSRAIIFDTTGSLFLYSFGIFIAHKENEIKEVFRVPLIYALILGVIVSVLRISLPEMLFNPLVMVGSITIPLALIVLGYRLAEIRVTHFKVSLLAVLFKIIGVFVIAFIVISLLSIKGITGSVILLEASMPSAVMSMVICQRYGRDPEIVTSVVMLSTLMSVVSIPLVLRILQYM